MKIKRKFLTGIIIFIVFIFAGNAYSDFGSFSGNSDYGSSSRESSRETSTLRPYSSGTTRRTHTGGSFRAIPLASSVTRQNNLSSSLESDEDEMTSEDFDECMGVVFILAVFFVFWLVIHNRNKRRKSERVIINTAEPVKTLRPMNEYLELDPEFDEERIKALISNLYVQMQDTWHAKDISSLRPYMTDAFYSQMDRQLDQFRKSGKTDYTENIAVLNVGLKGWRQSAGRDYITVRLNSRIVSYVLDDRTGKLLSGDRKREKFMEYEIELTRKSGLATTPESEGLRTATCPHCGAPLKLNASAQCEYCGSIIESVNSDWAICGMKGISQRTV